MHRLGDVINVLRVETAYADATRFEQEEMMLIGEMRHLTLCKHDIWTECIRIASTVHAQIAEHANLRDNVIPRARRLELDETIAQLLSHCLNARGHLLYA